MRRGRGEEMRRVAIGRRSWRGGISLSLLQSGLEVFGGQLWELRSYSGDTEPDPMWLD